MPLESLVALASWCGAPETIRTSGLRIRSPLLYPAELRAQQEKFLTDLYGFGKIKNWLKTYFLQLLNNISGTWFIKRRLYAINSTGNTADSVAGNTGLMGITTNIQS